MRGDGPSKRVREVAVHDLVEARVGRRLRVTDGPRIAHLGRGAAAGAACPSPRVPTRAQGALRSGLRALRSPSTALRAGPGVSREPSSALQARPRVPRRAIDCPPRRSRSLPRAVECSPEYSEGIEDSIRVLLAGIVHPSGEQSSAVLDTRRVSKTAFECSSRVSRTPSESSRLLSGRLGHPSREQSSAVGEARRPRRRALESSFGASRPRVDAGSSFREAREGRLGSTPRPRGEGLDFEAVRAAEKRRAGAGGATSATPCRCVACSP